MSWLFGASTSPYPGRHLRAVHLRMIEKQGFSPEDFELGLSCFEDAMKDMGAPPVGHRPRAAPLSCLAAA